MSVWDTTSPTHFAVCTCDYLWTHWHCQCDLQISSVAAGTGTGKVAEHAHLAHGEVLRPVPATPAPTCVPTSLSDCHGTAAIHCHWLHYKLLVCSWS